MLSKSAAWTELPNLCISTERVMPFSPTVKLTQTCGSADTEDNDAE